MFRQVFRSTGAKVAACAAGVAAAACYGTSQALAEAEAVSTAEAPETKLCIDKLACHRGVPPPRIPTVLVSCGSFNPPTIMHLRMFDLATAALAERGYDVWGCYMSPVADAYGKKGLAPVQHRLEMCSLAAAGTANVMVDGWEAAQPGYTRTLQVLRHVKSSLRAYMKPAQKAVMQQQQQAEGAHASVATSSSSSADAIHAQGLAAAAAAAAAEAAGTSTEAAPAAGPSSSSDAEAAASRPAAEHAPPSTSPSDPAVMLLCGADLLATLNEPGVWKDPDVLLGEHGIVCVARAGTDIQTLLDEPGTLLNRHRDRILVVEEPVQNLISSSMVRWLLAQAKPVRYLVPDAVLAYIQQHGLYSTYQEDEGVVHV